MAVLHFDPATDLFPFLVGLAMCVIGAVIANAGCARQRTRTLDEEFEAGYRAGYRCGRRAPRLEPIENVTPIRRVHGGLSAFSRAVQHGGIPKAPVGAVAGDRADARWAEAYPD